MKKHGLMVLVAALALVAAGACSKGYESLKNKGGMNIALKADSYPLVKGDNTLTVKATDEKGMAVADAAVHVRFYMPPMPGMAPMDSTTRALARGDEYQATVNASMEGGWKAEVTLQQPGKEAVSTTFNLDAR